MLPDTIGLASMKPKQRNRLKLVAVHLGVGNSSRDQEIQKDIAKQICEQVMLEFCPDTQIKSGRDRELPSLSCNNILCQKADQNNNMASGAAEMAVARLVEKLENQKSLNCGYGSNLNIKGKVECDASLMSDRINAWVGVGAVHGCKNPILLAKSLHDHWTIQRPLGLIQSNFLVGSGAKLWMQEHCPHLSVIDSCMISSDAFSKYQKFKSKYDASKKLIVTSRSSPGIVTSTACMKNDETPQIPKAMSYGNETTKSESLSTRLDHGTYCLKRLGTPAKISDSRSQTNTTSVGDNNGSFVSDHPYSKKSFPLALQETDNLDCNYCAPETENDDAENDINEYLEESLDTVGAIAIDSENYFACAISSGGLILKYKGRIGQAAVPGAGCWAEDSVAITTTGVGEYLTANLFAKRFHDKVKTVREKLHIDSTSECYHTNNDQSAHFSNIIQDCFQELFRSPTLKHVPSRERPAGLLQVSSWRPLKSPPIHEIQEDDYFYLSFAHSTKSMCIGYMTCNDTFGHAIMSLNDGNDDCLLVKCETMRFSLRT